jgi:hypothetical protein
MSGFANMFNTPGTAFSSQPFDPSQGGVNPAILAAILGQIGTAISGPNTAYGRLGEVANKWGGAVQYGNMLSQMMAGGAAPAPTQEAPKAQSAQPKQQAQQPQAQPLLQPGMSLLQQFGQPQTMPYSLMDASNSFVPMELPSMMMMTPPYQ